MLEKNLEIAPIKIKYMRLDWLQYNLIGNPISNWLYFSFILVVGFLAKRGLSLLVSQIVYKFIKSEARGISIAEFVRLTRRPFEFIISLIIIYLAFLYLHVPAEWGWTPANEFGLLMIIRRIFFTVIAGAVAWLGIGVIKFASLVFKQRSSNTITSTDDQLVPFLKDTLIVIWTLGVFLLMLSRVYGVNVWALITSLGVGGIVVALAARETFENLIASIAIMLEHPFVVGDNIVLGAVSGEIERIGFRSTRIRSDDGSLIHVPNRLFISQSLENVTNRKHRRVKFHLQLDLHTSTDKLKIITEKIREYLKSHNHTKQDDVTVRVEAIGTYSIDILIIYHVNEIAWKTYIGIKEEITLHIIEIVRNTGANFALVPPK